MSNNNDESTTGWNDVLHYAKLAGMFVWSVMTAGMWLVWVNACLNSPEPMGVAGVIVPSMCCGGTYIMGLFPALLLLSLLRR